MPRDAGASYGLLGRVRPVVFRLFGDNQIRLRLGGSGVNAPRRSYAA
jgi:hypothetical protein